MKARVRTALGIDIGLDRVSMAVVARTANGYRLVRFASGSLAEGPAGSRAEGAADGLSRAVARLKRQARIPRMKAAMGVSVSPLVLQMLDLPRQVPSNIREFVDSELGQYVTLSGKTIISDFYAVGSGRGPQKRLLSAAGEKETVQKFVKICDATGLTIQTVEPSILAYARARCTQMKTGVHAGRLLIAEINARQLSACLLRKGILDFVRTKSIPAEAQTSPAANDWLADEIHAMMRHYSLETAGDEEPWEVNILIRDGAPATQDIVQAVKDRTGVSPETITECDKPESAGREIRDSRAPAMGLAIRMLEGQSDPWKINLLPRDVIRARLLTRHVLITSIAVATVFLVMLLSLLAVAHVAATRRAELDRKKIAQQAPTTVTLVSQLQSVNDQIASAEGQIEGIRKTFEGQTQVDWPGMLKAVADSTQIDVQCVTRLWSQDSRRLEVRGFAVSGNAVRDFVQALSRAGLFESVSLGSIQRWQGNDALLQYELDCVMKPAL